jgi:hypothetical protein
MYGSHYDSLRDDMCDFLRVIHVPQDIIQHYMEALIGAYLCCFL